MLLEELSTHFFGYIIFVALIWFPIKCLVSFSWKMYYELGFAWGACKGHQRATDIVGALGEAGGMDRVVDGAFLEEFDSAVRKKRR